MNNKELYDTICDAIEREKDKFNVLWKYPKVYKGGYDTETQKWNPDATIYETQYIICLDNLGHSQKCYNNIKNMFKIMSTGEITDTIKLDISVAYGLTLVLSEKAIEIRSEFKNHAIINQFKAEDTSDEEYIFDDESSKIIQMSKHNWNKIYFDWLERGKYKTQPSDNRLNSGKIKILINDGEIYDIKLSAKKRGTYSSTLKSIKSSVFFKPLFYDTIFETAIQYDCERSSNPIYQDVYHELFEDSIYERSSVSLKTILNYSSIENWFYNQFGFIPSPKIKSLGFNKLYILGCTSQYVNASDFESLSYSFVDKSKRLDEYFSSRPAIWKLSRSHKNDKKSMAIGSILFYLYECNKYLSIDKAYIEEYVKKAVSLGEKIDICMLDNEFWPKYRKTIYSYFLKFEKDEKVSYMSPYGEEKEIEIPKKGSVHYVAPFKDLDLPKNFELLDSALKLVQQDKLIGGTAHVYAKSVRPSDNISLVYMTAFYSLVHNNRRYTIVLCYDYYNHERHFTPVFTDSSGKNISYGDDFSKVPSETQDYIRKCVTEASNKFFQTAKGKKIIKATKDCELPIPF